MTHEQKRKSIRFRSEPPLTAIVNGNLPALAITEAAKGCGLAMVTGTAPAQGEEITVTLGTMAPLKGVVRWSSAVDEDLVKLGIEYLES